MAEIARAMMLDAPPAAVSELVGELCLLDRVAVDARLLHSLGELELGEEVEDHGRVPLDR
jgi:hypothetical protein